MGAPIDVLAVMDAAAMGAYQRGHMTGDRHFPGVREYEQARAAVAALIEADERNIETLDSLIHAMALPMPDELHMKALREALPRLLEEKRAALARVNGVQP